MGFESPRVGAELDPAAETDDWLESRLIRSRTVSSEAAAIGSELDAGIFDMESI
jgi:hypothetical protein